MCFTKITEIIEVNKSVRANNHNIFVNSKIFFPKKNINIEEKIIQIEENIKCFFLSFFVKKHSIKEGNVIIKEHNNKIQAVFRFAKKWK